MGATVTILQSDKNLILPFLMNSYSDLEYNQCFLSFSERKKKDEEYWGKGGKQDWEPQWYIFLLCHAVWGKHSFSLSTLAFPVCC